jgi:site-specific DNA recombinase
MRPINNIADIPRKVNSGNIELGLLSSVQEPGERPPGSCFSPQLGKRDGLIAAVYCRISSPGETHDNVSLQTQREACLKFGEEKGYHIDAEHIVLETFSGLTLHRPELRRVRDWITKQEISGLIIYSTDRFSRDGYDLLTLVRDCEFNDVKLLCVTESIEGGSIGELINFVRGFASKLEAGKIKERTLRGKEALAKAGGMPGGFGRYNGYLGLRYDSNAKRLVHTEQIHIAKEILTRAISGESASHIARDLQQRGVSGASGGPIHRSSVTRVLRNAKAYSGIIHWREHEIRGKVEPIITEAEAELILLRLKRNKELSYGAGKRMWITGRVFCSICGRRYVLDGRKGCHCNGNDNRVPNRCNSPKIPLHELNALAYGAMSFALIEPDAVIEQARKTHEAWQKEKHEWEGLQQQAKSIWELRDKRRKLLSFQHENGGLSNAEYIQRLEVLKKEEQDDLALALFSEPEPLTPEQASEAYDIIKAYKPLRLHFDEVLRDPRDKFADELAEKVGLKVYIAHPESDGQKYSAYVSVNLPIPQRRLPFPDDECPSAVVTIATVTQSSPSCARQQQPPPAPASRVPGL